MSGSYQSSVMRYIAYGRTWTTRKLGQDGDTETGCATSFVVVVVASTRNVVEAELVGVFARRNNTNPIPKLILLQVLFGKVLDVPLREGNTGSDDKLVLAFRANLDIFAKVTLLARDLHVVSKELFISRTVEDAVLRGLAVVYNKSVLCTSLSGSSFGLC